MNAVIEGKPVPHPDQASGLGIVDLEEGPRALGRDEEETAREPLHLFLGVALADHRGHGPRSAAGRASQSRWMTRSSRP